MKHTSLLFFAFLIFLSSCKKEAIPPVQPHVDVLATGWSKIENLPGGYLDIFFTDADNGFLVAPKQILKTNDGGLSWVLQKETMGSLINIAMHDANNAIFVARDSVLYITHDGANTLDSVALADKSLNDACFAGNTGDIAFAVGDKLWKTNDRGYSWKEVHDFGKTINYRSVYFLNELVGFVGASSKLYKTIDGGKTWETSGNWFPAAFISFPDNENGYTSTGNAIYKTTDAGTNWTSVIVPTTTTGISDIHFVSSKTGYVLAGNLIYKTEDAGKSWQQVVMLGTEDANLIELHFINEKLGWVCGTSGYVLKYSKP